MNVRLVPLAFLAVVPFASPASAERPTVGQLTILGITYSGTGCPGGSVAYTWTDDGGLFELVFSKFELVTGPGVPATEAAKGCDIVVRIAAPDGVEPWVPAVEYDGFAQLDPGVEAMRVSTYKLTGDPPDGQFEAPIEVADDGSYAWVDRLQEPRCTPGKGPPVKSFRIRTRAELRGNGGVGLLDVEDTAGAVRGPHVQKWHISTHKCM